MDQSLEILSQTPEDTAQIARNLAPLLGKGDVILIEGQIGGGKTHFARSLIQHLLSESEDIPSPTFTLVQTYGSSEFEIWHCDLYRLSHPDEVFELGLIDAFEDSLCLVEWPDRLGDLKPDTALTLQFSTTEQRNQRIIKALWHDPRWNIIESALNV